MSPLVHMHMQLAQSAVWSTCECTVYSGVAIFSSRCSKKRRADSAVRKLAGQRGHACGEVNLLLHDSLQGLRPNELLHDVLRIDRLVAFMASKAIEQAHVLLVCRREVEHRHSCLGLD
mmetsp:Transcript_69462/g.208481  ORF Transcript_69462/g.208481 Transcript_69462/m.208481 type:complete len:118 (+) Transcript_69462:312-665(+)